jgi:pimeloyl-ACP methyl ester carboxylesterase
MAVRGATPLLLPGNMCDARLWTAEVRDALPTAIDVDLSFDDRVDAMATRALAQVEGSLLPVGFSMGGIVALAMARLAPERIAGLVLLDTNPSADLPERASVRPRQQADVRGGELERIVVQELKPHYLARANRENIPLLATVRDMALRLGADVFVRQSEALRTRPDQRGVLATLDLPVLIACGAEDDLCPPAWHEAMAAEARTPTLHVVAGAGHMLPLEQPGRLAAILEEWSW